MRNHADRHFPVQNAAQATYREIVERRAVENQIDFVAGVRTALTPMAFFETIMAKSYERLVEDGTEVSPETGLRAAQNLQAIIGNGDRGHEMAQMLADMNRIIEVMLTVVPESLHEEILARLAGVSSVQPAPVAFDASGDEQGEVAVFDPGDVDDDDDY